VEGKGERLKKNRLGAVVTKGLSKNLSFSKSPAKKTTSLGGNVWWKGKNGTGEIVETVPRNVFVFRGGRKKREGIMSKPKGDVY